MSPRYYWITALIVFGLTFAISWVTQRRSRKQVVMIFFGVLGGVVLFGVALIGVAELLVHLGIAQQGFIGIEALPTGTRRVK